MSAVFSVDGLASPTGRTLIWGKFRRVTISMFPPLARYLQQKYGLAGGCQNCGSSCKLLFRCPHWDDKSRLCSVYEDRPNICRLFPITPADIRDRNLVSGKTSCGFDFIRSGNRRPLPSGSEPREGTLVPVMQPSKPSGYPGRD